MFHEATMFPYCLLISRSQIESVDPQYQPRYTARDSYNCKINLVVGLPVNAWEVEYERAGLHTLGKYFSHMTHPHTGKRVLGPGIEVKAADGNLVDAQVQLGVWMTGFLMRAFAQRKSVKNLPPLIGCTAVGEDWKFYITIGVEGSGILKEVVSICFCDLVIMANSFYFSVYGVLYLTWMAVPQV